MQNLSPPGPRPKAMTLTIASYLRSVGLALESHGVPSEQVFREVALAVNRFGDPLERVPSEVVAKVFRRAVAVTGDPLFGLEVARHMHARHMHALASALVVSSSLREFCVRLERHWRFWTSEGSVQLVDDPGAAYLEICDVSEATAYESEDAVVAYLTRLMHEASDGRFTPERVELRRPRPADGGAAHRAALACPVKFGYRDVRIHLRSGDLDRPWPGGSREVALANEDVVIRYESRLTDADLDTRVLRLVIEHMANGPLAKADVARALGMSTSKLQQALAKRGTTFSAIVETARIDAAMSHIEDRSMAIKEIAFKLGFSSSSNFARAFKRWTGQSPQEARAETNTKSEPSTRRG